ncbi:D-aminoacyl-tRNA deacylase [Halofilum ochraceum]|uniref:D-aminoacyl-tRNA deacylase n=1 Tax=Halofilum ochraceum TaxID=1611323 RepID=UPI0008D8EC07|nr:D-aminoacyl-tRNA deacylase [Halofilum ochraceum]
MIGLLQRVTEASVTVGEATVARIGTGLLVLVGVERGDTGAQVQRLAERLLGYRVFPDDEGRMNLGVRDIGGALLLVPQFTLAADTAKGMRPGFGAAADPDTGAARFDELVGCARAGGVPVETGVFGAHMQVQLINDGPVTFHLRVPPAAS